MSRFDLQDKIAIVTGGSGGGIGTNSAMAYAKAGAHVVVASRTKERLERVADEIRSLGRRSLAIVTDICIPEQVDNMVKETVEEFGRIDILLNNAGGGGLSLRNPEDTPLEEWNAVIALNLTGTFLCSVAAGKVMIEQKKGKIINVSSGAGTGGAAIMAHYAAAKAGVINLTRSLASAWAQHNINVNCIVPGLIVTEGTKNMGMVPAETEADGTPVPLLQYPPNPENVADLAVFLGSAASDRITGDLIPIAAIGGT